MITPARADIRAKKENALPHPHAQMGKHSVLRTTYILVRRDNGALDIIATPMKNARFRMEMQYAKKNRRRQMQAAIQQLFCLAWFA
jgi:hypothetical protein